MANRLRVKVLINKGKKSVSLRKLPKLLNDIQKFIESLTEDTIGKTGEWVGEEFRSTHSIEYTAHTIDVVEQERSEEFDGCLRSILQSKPSKNIRQFTLAQYAKIAEPMSEETVAFGIGSDDVTGDERQIEWLDFDRQSALSLLSVGQSIVRSHGGIQGVIHSLFLGSDPPHFQLRELSTRDLISCEYDRSQYGEIVEALERQDAVLHVHGLIFTDFVNRKIVRLKVSHIDISGVLNRSDIDRFIGITKGLISPEEFQPLIDEMRDRG